MKLATVSKPIQELILNICSLFPKDIPTKLLNPPQFSDLLQLIHTAILQILNTNKEYEEMIQRLEGDVRNHIRIEQQLKIQIESIQEKLEEQEKIGCLVNLNFIIGIKQTQRSTKRKRERSRKIEE